MRAQESEDNAAALEKVAKLEAMAARAGSPERKPKKEQGLPPKGV